MITGTDALPSAPEAEQQVVASILLLPDVLRDVRKTLAPAHFDDDALRKTFSIMCKMDDSREPIEIPAIVSQLRTSGVFVATDPAAWLLEISQSVATAANAEYYATVIVEAGRKRRIYEACEAVCKGALNGRTSESLWYELDCTLSDFQREAAGAKPKYQAISATDLATADYALTYIIDRVLVEGQPCVIGGPKKSLKTSIAVDLALSLQAGGHFLGKFPVLQRRRVLLCSAESGLATLQQTQARVCSAMGIDPPTDGMVFCDRVPKITSAAGMDEFGRFVDDVQPEVVIFDPLYRMHNGDGAESIFKMGVPLSELGDLCLDRGATPIVCHHLKTGRLNQYAPAELDDLAYAGCAEYFRQWLLLSRRERYEPGSGLHRLWLTVGGSAGHNSLWAFDCDEGTQDDVGGRRWASSISKADDARDSAERRKAESAAAKAQEQLDSDRAAACRVLAKHPGGMSKSKIAELAGIHPRRWVKVFADMIERDELVEVEVKVSNHKKPIVGYKLNTSEGK